MSPTLRGESDPMYDDSTTGNYPSLLTREEMETVIKLERLELYNHVKPCGAKAPWRHLLGLGILNLPSIRTIGRIMDKQGLINESAGQYSRDLQ
jgi:hypothetical protein